MDIVIDLCSISFGQNGIHNFYWPLSNNELTEMRDTLVKEVVSVARCDGGVFDNDSEIFGIICHYFTYEAMAFYQASALLRRFTDRGYRLIWPEDSRLYPTIFANVAPQNSQSALIKTLRNGPQCHNPILKPLVKLRRSIMWNGFRLPSIFLNNPKDDIVACYANNILSCHASRVDKIVKYVLFSDWFKPLKGISIDKSKYAPINNEIIEAAIRAVRVAFKAGGEKLPDYQALYFRDYLMEAAPLVRYHLDRLKENMGKLPLKLWTGADGIIWSRMLRYAVRKSGGKVTGHEHGTGEGHIAYFNTKTFIEFGTCNTFVSPTETSAKNLRKILNPDFLISPNPPEIISLPEKRDGHFSKIETQKHDYHKVRNSKTKTLMYLPTIYTGEVTRFTQHNADLVMVDWQARLLGKLQSWGFEVLHKPHPEGNFRPPPLFFAQFGVKQVNKLFEKVTNLADIFIFDFVNTTAFSVALRTTKPIVFMDFGFDKFVSEAMDLIMKRCRLIKGRVDENNRMQIHWEELLDALNNPFYSEDTSFVDSYFIN